MKRLLKLFLYVNLALYLLCKPCYNLSISVKRIEIVSVLSKNIREATYEFNFHYKMYSRCSPKSAILQSISVSIVPSVVKYFNCYATLNINTT